MFKLLVVLSIFAQSYATYAYGGGGGNLGYAGGVIPAAVKSIWRLDVKPVQLPQEPIQPQTIEIPALELPVRIVYHSKSSGVFVQQVHTPGEPGQAEATRSEEEPHKLSHEVVRPVIQELREVIIPYRNVIQEIAPVVEEVKTIVAKGEGRQNAVLGSGGGVLPSINTGAVGSGLGGGYGLGLKGGMGSLFGGDGGNGVGLMGSGLGGYGAKTIASDLEASSSKSSSAGAAKKA